MGVAMRRANHQWPEFSANLLPRTYVEGVQHLAAKHGWKIEQNGDKFFLRSIPEVPLLPRNTVAGIVPTPSNHLAYFDTLGEVHEFLTSE
jgi:hypothetical protein